MQDVKLMFWKSRRMITTVKLNKIMWNSCEKLKWSLVCSCSYISASTWLKLKSKDSFEQLRASTFQNWPYFLNLVKIWWRYCQKQQQKKEIFWDTLYNGLINRHFQLKMATEITSVQDNVTINPDSD